MNGIVELFDVSCPACGKTLVCLPTDGVAGCHCSRCKIDFVAKIIGRTQFVQYGRGYRRGKPCDVVSQEESLLPKAVGRYDRPEPMMPILPVPGLVIDG